MPHTRRGMGEEVMEFPARVWRKGSSLVITIPKNIAEYMGLKEGDTIIVEIRKVISREG